ncbi:Hydra magnipapillata [Seminavis robusta]|uniref:Hydra magnipapillata n=1 Tax=Seminavis robusta TaxID=568900 RepID=A0A9N8HN58_9STRA|nr:Hydra magnipapillata [Seminavis robusta]|eukprot:Sro1056_g236180.1 Hydra magnipapillata (1517) ;mRNA; f:20877-25522
MLDQEEQRQQYYRVQRRRNDEFVDASQQQQKKGMNQYMKKKISKSHMQVIDSESSSGLHRHPPPQAPKRHSTRRIPISNDSNVSYPSRSLLDDASSGRTSAEQSHNYSVQQSKRHGEDSNESTASRTGDRTNSTGTSVVSSAVSGRASNMSASNNTDTSNQPIGSNGSFTTNASSELCLPLPVSRMPHVKKIFGREDELEALQKQLDQGATMTCINGTGGAGKSHLAIHACREWLEERPLSRFVIWINAATEWTLRISYLEALQQVLMGKVKAEDDDGADRGEIIIVAELLHRQLEQQRRKELAKEAAREQRRLRQNNNVSAATSTGSRPSSKQSTNMNSACPVFSHDTEDLDGDDATSAMTPSGYDDSLDVKVMDTKTLANLLWDSLLQGVSQAYQWIVVVQNVPGGMGGVKGAQGLKPFFFPTASTPVEEWMQGRILFTTRHQDFKGKTCLGPIHSLRVGRLEEEAAVCMLVANTVFDGDWEMGRKNLDSKRKDEIFEDAKRVAYKMVGPHYLDGSPLMIATAAGHIVSTQVTLRDYYALLKRHVATVLEARGYGKGKVQSSMKREASMSVCLEQAIDNANHKGLTDILSSAAFLCADNIPLHLLGGDEERVQSLCDLNLLTQVGKDTYAIHRIHQRTAVDAIIAVAKSTNGSGSSAYGKGINDSLGCDSGQSAKEEFLCAPDHAVRALRSAMSNFVAENASTWGRARSCIPHVEAIRIHHDLLHGKKELPPSFNHNFYAEIISNSASVMQWALKDRPAAFSMFSEALRLQRRLFRLVPSDDIISTTNSSNGKTDLAAGLSKTLASLGNLSEAAEVALKYYKEALDVFLQAFGDDTKSIELMSLYILLAGTEEKLEHSDAAYDLYKQGLELYFTIYGHNQNIYADDQKLFLAETLQKIGTLSHHQMQRHAEAELYLEGTVSLLRHVFEGTNERREDLADALETLGSICHAQGQIEDARRHYKNALKLKNSIQGDRRDLDIGNRYNLSNDSNEDAGVARSQDDTTSNASGSEIGSGVRLQTLKNDNDEDVFDLELVQVSSQDRHRMTAVRDVKLAKTLHRLGVLAWNLGSLKQAEDYFEKALALQQSGYGTEAKNEDLAITLFSLGGLCNDLHNNQVKACAYYRKALDCYYFVYGEDAQNESIAQLLHALGQSSQVLKKPTEAKAYLKKALAMKYIVYGGDDKINADLMATLMDLGKVSRDLQDNEDAIFYYRSALMGLYFIHGRDSYSTEIASTLTQLGGLSYNSGLLDDAKDYFEKCLHMKYHLYGHDAVNDDIASTLNNLGSLNARLKNYEEGFRYYEQALQQYNLINEQDGDDDNKDDIDSHRARTLHNLGLLSFNLKQFDAAERYYADSLKIKSEVFKDVEDSPELALTLTKLSSVETKRGKFEAAKYYQDQALKRSPTFLETHQNLINKSLLPATAEEAAALMTLIPNHISPETENMLKGLDFWKHQEDEVREQASKQCWIPFKNSALKRKRPRLRLKKLLGRRSSSRNASEAGSEGRPANLQEADHVP